MAPSLCAPLCSLSVNLGFPPPHFDRTEQSQGFYYITAVNFFHFIQGFGSRREPVSPGIRSEKRFKARARGEIRFKLDLLYKIYFKAFFSLKTPQTSCSTSVNGNIPCPFEFFSQLNIAIRFCFVKRY